MSARVQDCQTRIVYADGLQPTVYIVCPTCGGTETVEFLEDDLVVCLICDGPEGLS